MVDDGVGFWWEGWYDVRYGGNGCVCETVEEWGEGIWGLAEHGWRFWALKVRAEGDGGGRVVRLWDAAVRRKGTKKRGYVGDITQGSVSARRPQVLDT